MRTELGKIQKVSFGMGGYNAAMLGFRFELGGKDWRVHDFWGQWSMEVTERTQWTDAERRTGLGDCCMKVLKLLQDANCVSLHQLEGVAVEVTFDGNILKFWRILTEVI